MARLVIDDYYAVLGVPDDASADEIRRTFRRLARRHHPDLAGAAATALFQRMTEAYNVLSDAEARAAYDKVLRQGQDGARGGSWAGASTWDVQANRSPRRRATASAPVFPRFTGTIETLLARGMVVRAADDALEFRLSADEHARGGCLEFEVAAQVTCPTCGGVAGPDVWCTRCAHAGTVADRITVCIAVSPQAADRTTFAVPVDPRGGKPPLRVRIRV